MKYIFNFLFILYFFNINAQKSDSTIIQMVSINTIEKKQNAIEAYSDSINNFNGFDVPDFLFNPCLDLEGIFRLGPHDRESKRWKILNNVNNLEALKSISEIDNKRLKKVCKNRKGWNKKIISNFDMIELSFYALIQKRINQLEYINNLQGSEKKHYDRHILIDATASALNNYDFDDCKEIPVFFKEYDFDIKVGSKYWVSRQSAVSLRKLILGKVDNYQLHQCILNSNDVNIRKRNIADNDILNEHYKIHFQQYSTYELVKLRVEEIENNRRMLIGVMDIEK
jgi:hypothetical protein